MKIERPHSKEITAEEKIHLEILRKRIRYILTDGKLSREDIEEVWRLIYADGKVTVEELQVLRETAREVTGDPTLQQDWW